MNRGIRIVTLAVGDEATRATLLQRLLARELAAALRDGHQGALDVRATDEVIDDMRYLVVELARSRGNEPPTPGWTRHGLGTDAALTVRELPAQRATPAERVPASRPSLHSRSTVRNLAPRRRAR